jgi:hypothetical protein
VSEGVRAPIQQLEGVGQAKLEIKKDHMRKRVGLYHHIPDALQRRWLKQSPSFVVLENTTR